MQRKSETAGLQWRRAAAPQQQHMLRASVIWLCHMKSNCWMCVYYISLTECLCIHVAAGLTSLAFDWFITKKRESRTVARPTFRGSRIAHHGWTSKHAEASRRICVNTERRHSRAGRWWNQHIHTGIYHLLQSWPWYEICEISENQDWASSKRFSIMFADPPALPLTELLRDGLHLQNY